MDFAIRRVDFDLIFAQWGSEVFLGIQLKQAINKLILPVKIVLGLVNPLTPKSDKQINSPYNLIQYHTDR